VASDERSTPREDDRGQKHPDTNLCNKTAVVDTQRHGESGEVFQLLSLAEKLQEQCSAASQRLMMYYLVTVVFGILLVGGFVTDFIDPPKYAQSIGLLWYFLVGVLVVGAGLFAAYIYVVRPIRTRKAHDARALNEVVRILRESVPPIITAQEWSMLQIAEFKIRLSRFEIAPSEPFSVSSLPANPNDVFTRLAGNWHLDYSTGEEDIRIDEQGNYYYSRGIAEELVFTLSLQEFDKDQLRVCWEKVNTRPDRKERIHTTETLRIDSTWTTMTGSGVRPRRTSPHRLVYRRL
jgi:hypothetical protein